VTSFPAGTPWSERGILSTALETSACGEIQSPGYGFIRGNHDNALLRARHHSVISYGGYTFYLVHDPCDVPDSWKGWVIHGHTHNNRMDIHPFINGIRRTINVSCECTGYTPVSLDRIISLDLDTIERMETLSDRPVRKGHPVPGKEW